MIRGSSPNELGERSQGFEGSRVYFLKVLSKPLALCNF
jgi:hypothetical protein